MAHCSEAERLFAVSRVEQISALSGWDYHCVYDILLELIRHDLLDMISLMLPREGALLFAIRDILTSLKCDAGECILSGQFLAQHRHTQELLAANVTFVRRLPVNSRVLASFALDSGAGRHGLVWLQQQYRLADKDWAFRLRRFSSDFRSVVLISASLARSRLEHQFCHGGTAVGSP